MRYIVLINVAIFLIVGWIEYTSCGPAYSRWGAIQEGIKAAIAVLIIVAIIEYIVVGIVNRHTIYF